MPSGGWGGRPTSRIRATLAATLPSPCIRCGLPVQPWDAWHVGHRVDRAENPNLKWTWSNLGTEHAACNLEAGGQVGARRRNLDRRLRTW